MRDSGLKRREKKGEMGSEKGLKMGHTVTTNSPNNVRNRGQKGVKKGPMTDQRRREKRAK